MKLCKHIGFDEIEGKYLVREPAVIEPITNKATNAHGIRCSKCKTQLPIMKRSNGAIRIKLIPKGA